MKIKPESSLGLPLDKEHSDLSGIYCLFNIHNGKIYIGQAVCLVKRKRTHYSELKSNRHANRYLQNAYNKYRGEISFLILEYCNKEELDDKEQYWINRLNPEYNIVKDIFENKLIFGGFQEKAFKDGHEYKPEGYWSDIANRPDWHAWVYGGSTNPLVHRQHDALQ